MADADARDEQVTAWDMAGQGFLATQGEVTGNGDSRRPGMIWTSCAGAALGGWDGVRVSGRRKRETRVEIPSQARTIRAILRLLARRRVSGSCMAGERGALGEMSSAELAVAGLYCMYIGGKCGKRKYSKAGGRYLSTGHLYLGRSSTAQHRDIIASSSGDDMRLNRRTSETSAIATSFWSSPRDLGGAPRQTCCGLTAPTPSSRTGMSGLHERPGPSMSPP
nr:hypothetical protein CFP56_20884 [Quercus suber]